MLLANVSLLRHFLLFQTSVPIRLKQTTLRVLLSVYAVADFLMFVLGFFSEFLSFYISVSLYCCLFFYLVRFNNKEKKRMFAHTCRLVNFVH